MEEIIKQLTKRFGDHVDYSIMTDAQREFLQNQDIPGMTTEDLHSHICVSGMNNQPPTPVVYLIDCGKAQRDKDAYIEDRLRLYKQATGNQTPDELSKKNFFFALKDDSLVGIEFAFLKINYDNVAKGADHFDFRDA